jgi:NRPS condensation-like uncharacterized protein
MTVKRRFPVSIVDEIPYCVESAFPGLHLFYAWIFTLKGEVSRDACQKALDHTLNYYPKCKCILVNDYPSYKRWFRYRWELTDCSAPDIFQELEISDPDFSTTDAVAYYVNNRPALSIDISSHPPLKVLLIRTPKKTFLFFFFHHAVADGLGSFFFIQKFIQYYEEIFYQKALSGNQGTRLEDISAPQIPFRWNYFSLRRLRPYLKYSTLFRQEPPVRLYAPEAVDVSGGSASCVRLISASQLKEIRTTAKKHQATINDYLLAAAFRTVKQWAGEWIGQSERIYITVPMDLRSPEDRTLSNTLSGANIALQPERIVSTDELLQLIRKEVIKLRDTDIARTMVYASCLFKLIPLKLRTPLLKRSVPDFAPTLLLSNMGILSPNPSHQDEEGFHYLGPARICSIQGLPNAGGWPDTLIFTYNTQMIINMSVLNSCFSQETAEQFVDAFVGEITG